MSSQSNAPQAARRGRHRLRARWGLLVAALAWNCGPVARREEIITVEGDLAYVRADDTDYGCNGEVLRRQKHQGIGAAAAARYEASGGGLLGMRLRGLANEVLRTQRVVDGMVNAATQSERVPPRNPR